MSTIQELEQKVEQLERDILAEKQNTSLLKEKAEKAVEYALHAYKLDHYGFIWVYNPETGDYSKTKMRVVSPTVTDRALESRHIADKAIEGRHLQDNIIEGRMIKNKTIDGRSLTDDSIGPELIMDNSIPGDRYQANVLIPGKLADDAVATRNIQNKAVIAAKIGNDVVPTLVIPVVRMAAKNLQNQIDSLEKHGVALSDRFGLNPHIGISQSRLTDAWNNVYHLLEEALGRTLLGFTWQVTPTYIYGEWPTAVHITALPNNPEEVFEHIKLTVGGEVVDEVENMVPSYSFDIDLQQTTSIRLDAQLLGTAYYRAVDVHHYDSFWMGAGTAYADLMDESHAINFSQGSRFAKDVVAADGDHIFIIMGDTWVPGFIRADMDGVEIPFTSSDVTIDGHTYKVLVSDNTYSAGTYNVDING